MAVNQAPADVVVAAFGGDVEGLESLPGGGGRAWRAGPIVLRPSGDREEAIWKAELLATLEPEPESRTARPVRDTAGGWVRAGWEAWQRVPGEADQTRVEDVIRAGTAFHAAIANLDCPEFIARIDGPWSRADRLVWGEGSMPGGRLLDRLAEAFAPVASPAQLIHGDLLGNVLFAPGLPPAIIDWAPYWRPAGLGAAIAAVDATCWHGQALARPGESGPTPQWRQLLVRALAFRIATLYLLESWDDTLSERHAPVVDAVLDLEN